MNMQIRKIAADDRLEQEALALSRLAEEIWIEYYPPIIGRAQVDYMLEKFQSPSCIAEDIRKPGCHFYVAEDADGKRSVGYCAAFEQDGCLFLSKLYVLREYRRKGIGRLFFDTLLALCRSSRRSKITLNVNKDNRQSIAAYRNMGFTTVDDVKVDIGGGFFMDDYVMEYHVAL